jgi:8-oxo-dGTP pyrophosphatase MutT (NUDIX family)
MRGKVAKLALKASSPMVGKVVNGRHWTPDGVFLDWLAKVSDERGAKWRQGLTRLQTKLEASPAKASNKSTSAFLNVLTHEARSQNPVAEKLLRMTTDLAKGDVKNAVKDAKEPAVQHPSMHRRKGRKAQSASQGGLVGRSRHSRIIVLRQEKDKLFALLQRKALGKTGGGGRLSFVSGKLNGADQDSSGTAARKLYEQTGLLDVGYLEDRPEWLHAAAVCAGASPPLHFRKFSEDAHADWWLLVVRGSGTFGKVDVGVDCADVTPFLKHIPEAELAACHGHLWVPVGRKNVLSDDIPKASNIEQRIDDAVATLGYVSHLGCYNGAGSHWKRTAWDKFSHR